MINSSVTFPVSAMTVTAQRPVNDGEDGSDVGSTGFSFEHPMNRTARTRMIGFITHLRFCFPAGGRQGRLTRAFPPPLSAGNFTTHLERE